MLTFDPLATFSRPSFFWLFYLTVGWLLVWGGHAVLMRISPGYRVSPWPWYRLVGLVLLLFPFIRMANGLWESIGYVAQPGTVAPTRAPEVWWRIIRRNMVQNLVVPFVGLFLASGHAERLFLGARASLGRLRQGLRGTLESVGMWPRRSWTWDLMVGLAAFVVVFFAYAALANLLAPLREFDRGDASRVFDAITPLLAISLALMAGVTEEFLYRGVLLVRAKAAFQRVPVWAFLLGSSLVFALAHAGYGTIANMAFPFFFGLAAGLLVLWCGVWPAVIVHTLVNFMVFLGTLARNGYDWAPLVATGVITVAFVTPLMYFAVIVWRDWTKRGRGHDNAPGR